ncbi:thiamine pyrophosphate-binding protein [Raoultella sp. Lac2]|uniref:thiamine pyrophosphate-binding protein n=1 Tax=unclassified Raoultella TaxID=2627600 RepID=UPI001355C970|nr:thiamine pyrophosphate-binding protein [Raoultella sp. Lac2]MXF99156.1 thiamine pyrophosphate-binding protein [Raoultella sp. Lac1]
MSVITTAALQRRRGADVLLETLSSEGVEYIFGNPGTTELPLIDALLRNPALKYILALQEASAVAMADGYAQASGKPGFLNLHTAGGLGHGMGNLLNAKVSQTPLVVTAGQQDTRHAISDPLLYDDLLSIAAPAVKWAENVSNAAQLPVLIRRAFHDANAAPGGPVFLALPMDIMDELCDVAIGEPSQIDRRATGGSLPHLAKLLAGYQPGKVALIAGDEIYSSHASAETQQVAELLGAHVYGSSWPSRIPFPTSHPLWRGNMPTTARGIAGILQNYQAIFALGGKSLITILYSEGPAVPDNCAVYQLSADVNDLGRSYATRLSVVGDIKVSLNAMLPMLENATAAQRERYNDLIARARDEKQWAREALEKEVQAKFGLPTIAPLVAAHEAVRAIGPDVAIVDEALCVSSLVRQFLSSDQAGQYGFMRGGALGWGMPAAIGYCLGRGRQPVVCLVGDGAAMYSPQAMWSAAHENLPVTFVVMNNQEYNILKNFMRSQQHYTSAQTNTFVAMDIAQPKIDYQALAISMGLTTQCIRRAADIAPAIEASIASGKPGLIEIMVSTS